MRDTYTVLCCDNHNAYGFHHAETSARRAAKYAREFVAESFRNQARAYVLRGPVCIKAYENRAGRAVSTATPSLAAIVGI